MFAYPKQAEFNRSVPKTKIYAHTRVSKRLKQLFAAQVAEIIWKYKLSPETTNLPARDGIEEIQVFELQLKTPDLDPEILVAIDKAIPHPVIFHFIHDGKVASAAAYKRTNEAAPSKWIIATTTHYRGPSRPVTAERLPLPVTLNLFSLYEQIFRQHLPNPPRPGETLAAHIARCEAIEAVREQQQRLQSRLKREKQFNRKVELNSTLRALAKKLASLEQT